MKFYITGGTGFIGNELVKQLKQDGHEPVVLERDFTSWPKFLGEYSIINMAGRPIFARYNQKVKQEIYQSRINTTKKLFTAIKESGTKPFSFVSASAVGYYGNRGEEVLDENSGLGTDFLAKVCKDWEQTANLGCKELVVRCVNIRTGHVLGNGGLLGTLLPLFKWGLGGKLSSGKQYMSWISLKDVAGLYIFSALTENCSGPINACAGVVTNAEFTKHVAKFLHRPAFFTVPKFALKLLYGEFGELILYSQRASNKKLLSLDFKFNHNTLTEFFNSFKI